MPWPFDDEPEDSVSAAEAFGMLVLALMVVPGLIWWAGEVATFVTGVWEAFQ